MSKNFILILDGPMGSGKSTVGDLVHKKLKRTALLSMDRIKWFISDFKRSKKDNAITNAVLFKMYEEYLKQGIDLIVTQGFWKQKGSPFVAPSDFAALAKKYKVRFYFYQLDAPKEVLLGRIKNRKPSALIRTPIAPSRLLRNIRMWKKNKYQPEKTFWSHEQSAKNIANQILKNIRI